MKTRTKKFGIAGLLFAALIGLGIVVGAQTALFEVPGAGILFRAQDPEARFAGSLSWKTLGGTAIATLNQSGQLGGTRKPATVGTAATLTLTTADCGRVIVGTATSSTQTYTLPVVTSAGCTFTFIAGHASSEILIDGAEASGASFIITTFAAVGADADTGIVTDTDVTPGIKNTAATNAIGDTCTLVADGVDTWRSVGICTGIWAAQ